MFCKCKIVYCMTFWINPRKRFYQKIGSIWIFCIQTEFYWHVNVDCIYWKLQKKECIESLQPILELQTEKRLNLFSQWRKSERWFKKELANVSSPKNGEIERMLFARLRICVFTVGICKINKSEFRVPALKGARKNI